MADERLIDIEMKISHHELQIEKLEQVVYEQQAAITQLETKLTQLIKSIEEGALGLQIGPGNQKPPHY